MPVVTTFGEMFSDPVPDRQRRRFPGIHRPVPPSNVLVSVTFCDWLAVLCPGCGVPAPAVAQNGVFAGEEGEIRSRFDCGRLPAGLPWIHSVSPQIRTTQRFDHGQLDRSSVSTWSRSA